MKRVCVFCGANRGARPDYEAAARATGRALAGRGFGLVYGGGSTGLMGAIADEVLAAGGAVTGVIPQALVRAEIAHRNLTELRVVPDMHQRKAAMYELADAFIILPGGIGTMDEFFEAVVWLHLGLHRKPCGLLNVAGFFDHLVTFMAHIQAEGFMRTTAEEIALVDDDVDRLLERMHAFEPPPPPRWPR
jgi:uncharacterized protein (TIGR00730 family)